MVHSPFKAWTLVQTILDQSRISLLVQRFFQTFHSLVISNYSEHQQWHVDHPLKVLLLALHIATKNTPIILKYAQSHIRL